MFKRFSLASTISIVLAGACSNWALAADVPAGSGTGTKPLTAGITVSTSGLPQRDDLTLAQLQKFGLRCVSTSSAPTPALVSQVSFLSPAYRKALKYSDKILSVQTGKGYFCLRVERQGKIYSVTLSENDLLNQSVLRSGTAQNVGGNSLTAMSGRLDNGALYAGINRQSTNFNIDVDEHPFPVLEIANTGHEGVIQSIPNCWFEAAVSAVADTRDGAVSISNMISKTPYGYQVKFPGSTMAVEIGDADLRDSGIIDPAKWAAVLDAAERTVYPDNSPSRGANTGNPGVKVGLELLTGKRVSFVRPDEMTDEQLSDLLTRLSAQFQPVTVATKGPGEHRQRMQPVTPNHAYSLVAFDRAAGLITLRNPLGQENSNGAGVVEIVSQDEIRMNLDTARLFLRYVAYPE